MRNQEKLMMVQEDTVWGREGESTGGRCGKVVVWEEPKFGLHNDKETKKTLSM